MPIDKIHKEIDGKVSYGAIVALADTTIGIGARTVMGKGEESATLEIQIIQLEQTFASHLISNSIIRREDDMLITGTVTVSEGGGASVEVTGVEATTPEAPGVLIWTVVDTSQTPNWTEIAA